ncbi:hypothetical protein CEP54_006264 [Fusarium duplospermum]|uniref:Uncharacterized protein n=1 Tax=Fusarium duplospermum TaxID=1325734 RepID=A0A428Q7Z9_9HYPO|nr:hypothetical protein CEP54_006264 [Fusarium duplospermum]
MSPFSIAGKRVVATGGARGIGASVCRALVQARANVAIFDVLDTVGEPLATSLSQDGPGQAFYQSVDVSNRAAVFSAMDSAAVKLSGLDSVVNCAALERHVPIEELAEKDLTPILDVNVKGAFFLAQAAFPHLKAHGGVLLNFGSDGGLTRSPGISAYSASKGAIHSLTRMLALEWGK